MAKGVLVTEAKYYDDSTTYSGAEGSETNRWVVEDAYDLCAMKETGVYTLVKDINISDYPEYKFGTMYFNNAGATANITLYGDGHKIQNMFLKDNGTIDGLNVRSIYDLIFENIICMSCTASRSELFPNTTLYNCKLGIFLFNSDTQYIFKTLKSYDSTFNVHGIVTDGIVCGQAYTHTRSHLNFNVRTLKGTNTHCISGVNLDNSYITGKLVAPTILYGLHSSNLEYSYISLEIETDSPDAFGVSNTGATSSFIDVSRLPSEIATTLRDSGIVGLYALDESQCKDPDYLISIGFPVIPIDN